MEREIDITIRTVKVDIIFACCYEEIYYPEPIPLTLTDTQKEGLEIKSLVVWKDMFLDSPGTIDYITELCNNKCRRVLGRHAVLCEDGYELDILDYYEE